MIYEFYPWKIDVDIEKTRNFYQENDYSSDKDWNRMFMDTLNPMQKEFFDNLGVDMMKMEVHKTEFEDNPEVPFIYSINFLLSGKFLSLTKHQLDLYMDEEIFGQRVVEDSIEGIEVDSLINYEGLGLPGTGVRFRHPATYWEESQFQEWDCGFINGTLIVRGQTKGC